MTPEEERENDRKIIAECRSWKRQVSAKMNKMTPEERREYYRKFDEQLRAEGFRIGPAPDAYYE
ncbi:hypothetical protein AGMMS50268_05830 [Spirochaetia bacterium]|nr:hypothetical protein AGMMS49546_09430 [Spirochaetia bacterium]GHV90080.1 hypothetical protein AGMMS50268_05830 [Spirochaetia bacterium]